MKNIIFILSLILNLSNTMSHGQNNESGIDLALYYNQKYIGQAISFDLNKYFKHNSFTIGTSIYTNQIPKDNYYFSYKNKAYAKNINQRFGFNIGYSYSINKKYIIPFLFTHYQFSNICFRELIAQTGQMYSTTLSPNTKVIEGLIGIGYNLKLYKSYYFYQSVAIGYSLMFQKLNPIIEKEWANSVRLGITYRLK